MANKHLSYSEFKQTFGDLGVTIWTKYNWLDGFEYGMKLKYETLENKGYNVNLHSLENNSIYNVRKYDVSKIKEQYIEITFHQITNTIGYCFIDENNEVIEDGIYQNKTFHFKVPTNAKIMYVTYYKGWNLDDYPSDVRIWNPYGYVKIKDLIIYKSSGASSPSGYILNLQMSNICKTREMNEKQDIYMIDFKTDDTDWYTSNIDNLYMSRTSGGNILMRDDSIDNEIEPFKSKYGDYILKYPKKL